jgi:predicted O-linked N-acetylglucosamine transferase (SPINDLY family)
MLASQQTRIDRYINRLGRYTQAKSRKTLLVDLLSLAADTDEAFVGAAVGLAGDLPRLALLRGDLHRRLAQSPLMDGARFARDVESALRSAWRTKRLANDGNSGRD